jgi:hypothetical protein
VEIRWDVIGDILSLFEKGSSSCIFTRLVSLDTAVLSHRVQRSICQLSFLAAQFKCQCPHVIVFTSKSSFFVFFHLFCSFMLWNETFLVSGSVARGAVPKYKILAQRFK